MILVEEGPLTVAIDDFLYQLQNRLYDTVDAAIYGQLAQKFPESKGKILLLGLIVMIFLKMK